MTNSDPKRPAPRLGMAGALAALALAAPAASASVDAMALHDGLLVGDQRVYVMRPGGGIEARAIDTGASLWKSDAADRPVLVSDGKLLAQREDNSVGKLALVTLATADGDRIGDTVIELPDDVLPSVDDRLDSRFRLLSEDHARPGELVWRFDYRLMQGAPTAAAEASERRSAGVIDVDLDTAQIAAASRAAPARAPADLVAQVSFADKGARAFYSGDRRHVLVSRKSYSRNASERYEWRVHDLDGNQIGKLRAPVSFTPFVVRDGVLLFVSAPAERRVGERMQAIPLTLRAVDLARGEEAWSSALRDTRYTGPYPP